MKKSEKLPPTEHLCSSKAENTKPCSKCRPPQQAKEELPKTQVVVHFDCGFANSLFIRGEGISTLSWEKGLSLKNLGPAEWLWESDRPFSTMQFKILLNDSAYEAGDNHPLAFGQKFEFTPEF